MFLKIPDNYLKERLSYMSEFLLKGDVLVGSILNNKDFSINYIESSNNEGNDNKNNSFDKVELDEFKNKFNNLRMFWIDKSEEKLYVEESEINWIKSKRVLWMVVNSLINIYINYKAMNHAKPEMIIARKCSPIDFSQHFGESVKYDEMVFFIDIMTILLGREKMVYYLSDLRGKTLLQEKENPNPFKFISGKDEFEWLVRRLNKNLLSTDFDINDICNSGVSKMVISCFDYWSMNSEKEKTKLFLLETKKSLSQKRFRDKVKDKEVLNTYISKEAKTRLKHLARKNNLNINQVLEILILGDDKRSQSQRLLDALESTME